MMHRSNRFIPVVAGCALFFGSVLMAAAQDETYTVQTGDSLDKIGAIYDVQVACLAKANELSLGALLSPGDVVTISYACPLYDGVDFVTNPREVNTSVTANLGQGGGGGAADVTYQVQRGDSLDSIGQALNVSVVALQVANKLTPGAVLQPGQALTIPADAPVYGEFPALTAPDDPTGDTNALGQGGGGATDLSGGDTTYVVQPNDTLDTIGALFDVQTACLANENDLADPAKIYPGQQLAVKESCPRYDGFDFVKNPRPS